MGVHQCDFCVKKLSGGRPGGGAEDCPGPSHRSFTHCWRAACWVAKADGDRLFFLLPFCPQWLINSSFLQLSSQPQSKCNYCEMLAAFYWTFPFTASFSAHWKHERFIYLFISCLRRHGDGSLKSASKGSLHQGFPSYVIVFDAQSVAGSFIVRNLQVS